MDRRQAAAAIALGALAPGWAFGRQRPRLDAGAAGFTPEGLERIGRAYRDAVAAGEIPGAAILISRHGKLAYSDAIGFRNDVAKTPMTLDTRFFFASMTKPITTVAAMTLIEKGRIGLDDPIARYIPELAGLQVGREAPGPDGKPVLVPEPARRQPIVRDLLRHTAGFTYGQFGNSLVQQANVRANVMDPRQTNAELMTKLARLPLAYQPGTTFEYGMSTDVLGRVIEIASGLSLGDFIARHVAGPLGMKDTSFGIDDPDRIAMTHAQPFRFPAGTPNWHMGGGGLIGTAQDYHRFAQMMLNRGELDGVRILSPRTVAMMTRNQLPRGIAFGPYDLGNLAPTPAMGQSFGFGFAVRERIAGNPAPGSVGDYHWAGSSGTYFWVDPARSLIAVVLTAAPAVRAAYRLKARELVYGALRG